MERRERKLGGIRNPDFSRRDFLKRSLAMGLSAPAITGLLAACGGGDDEPDAEVTDTAVANETSDVIGATPTTSDAEATTTVALAQTTATNEQTTGVETEVPSAPTKVGGTFQSSGVDTLTMGKDIEPAENDGGTVIEGWSSDLESLHPFFSASGPTGAFQALIFEAMFVPHPETLEPVGRLAEGWEVSEDAITWTIQLRQGVSWQDGEAFDASDVKFAYDRLMNEDTAALTASDLKDKVDSVEIVGDLILTFALKQANADFLLDIGDTGIVAEHIWTDIAPADMATDGGSTGEDPSRVVGTGPFRFEEWVTGERATAVAYDDYWGGAPHLDSYIFKVVSSASAAVAQLQTGEIDIYTRVSAAAEPDFEDTDVLIIETATLNLSAYATNLDPEKTTLFQDANVRKALLLAIDRQAMVEAIRFGHGDVAIGTIAPLSWAYNPDGIKDEFRYEYDPDQAKQLLDEAGWTAGAGGVREKDGQRMSFSMWTATGFDAFTSYQVAIQEFWREIGVEMTPQVESLTSLVERILVNHDYETFIISLGFGLTPDQTNNFACDSYPDGANLTKYCNPEVDRILLEALGETDRDRRIELYTDFQNILLDDLPVAGIDFEPMLTAVNSRVHNVFPSAAGVARKYNPQTWWVDA